MKLKYIFTFIIIFFISCKTSKNIIEPNISNEKRSINVADGDFSKSAKDAIIYLKTLIQNPKFETIKIEIYNFHNGVTGNQINIKKQGNSLLIETTFIKLDNSEKTEFNKVQISEFITKLNEVENNAENQIVFAGNYQKIYIDNGENEKLFLTRKALGLLQIIK